MFGFRQNKKIDPAKVRSAADALLAADLMAGHYRAAAGRVDAVGMPANHSGRSNTRRVAAPEEKLVQRGWRKAATWTTAVFVPAVFAPVVYFGGGELKTAPEADHKTGAAPMAARVETPVTLPDVPEITVPDVPNITVSAVLAKPEIVKSPAAVAEPVTAGNGVVQENVIPEKIYSPVRITSDALRPFARIYPTISANDICKAIAGEGSIVTSDYGLRGGKPHYGQDCRAWFNKPVFALFGGTVAYAGHGYNKGFGNMVKICGKASICAIYGHANAVSVKTGEFVHPGQQVILAGNSGHATGPHVHFEVRRFGAQDGKHGSPVNLPAEPRIVGALLPEKPGVLQKKLADLRARM